MADIDALVARLRAFGHRDPSMCEAADAIEAMRAETERLRAEVTMAKAAYERACLSFASEFSRSFDATARADRLAAEVDAERQARFNAVAIEVRRANAAEQERDAERARADRLELRLADARKFTGGGS